MNQNRCCPGVPNRYSTSPASRVTRPKSIATVVVVLSGVWLRSSKPSLAVVMTASVVSGVISETEPTNVVLPAPKPPATTILTDVTASVSAPGTALELAKSTKHPFQKVEIRAAGSVVRLMNPDQSLHRHVTDQDTGDSKRYPQHRGDLSNRSPVAAVAEYGLAFRAQNRKIACLIVRCRHHGLDLQLIARFRPPASDGVRANQGTHLLWHLEQRCDTRCGEVVGPLSAAIAPGRH